MEKFLQRYVKLPAQQRYVGFAVVAGAIIALFYFLLHIDQGKKLQGLKQSYLTAASERSEKQAYIENLSRYETRLQELQQNLDTARALLPDAQDVPQLLAQLSNKGRQTGLVIENFEPKGETKKDFFAEIAFDVKVRGTYHEIASFIDSVVKLDRIVNVSGLAMVNPRNENKKVVLEGMFTIKTYRFIDVPGTPP